MTQPSSYVADLDVLAKGVNRAVTVLDTNTRVLRPNAKRKWAIFVNDSDTVIYLALGETATINSGIRLNASGGAYEINALNLWRGPVSAISSVTTKILCVVEVE